MIGDSLETSSPQDPIFFPIHPTLERLWVRSKLAKTFVNETWDGWSAYGRSCSGHWPGDELALGQYLVDLRVGEDDGSPLRVGELYVALDPTNLTNLDYVFDDFSWPHCTALGFDMDLD